MPGSLSVRTYSPDATMPLDRRPCEISSCRLCSPDRPHGTPIGAASCARGSARLCGMWSDRLRLAPSTSSYRPRPLRESLLGSEEVGDLERLVSRAAQGRSNARELVALRPIHRSDPGHPRRRSGVRSPCGALRSPAEITEAPDLEPSSRARLVRIAGCRALRRSGAAGLRRGADGIADASRSAREVIAGLEPRSAHARDPP